MAKQGGPFAPLNGATIANGATDYSQTFQPKGASPVSCCVQLTGGTSGTITCTLQYSGDGTTWTDHVMTGTFTFTGGAGTTQVGTRAWYITGGGGASTVSLGCPAPYVRLKIANGAAASITGVSVTWMAGQ